MTTTPSVLTALSTLKTEASDADLVIAADSLVRTLQERARLAGDDDVFHLAIHALARLDDLIAATATDD